MRLTIGSGETGMLGLGRALAAALLAVLVAGCMGGESSVAVKPLSDSAKKELAAKGMRVDAPILVRIFKNEAELEVWKQMADGQYDLFKTYPICAWSGHLGPKLREGDRQAPEGFYTVAPGQMNPRSQYHLAFNIGYPNAFDRSLRRTGANLMVHGDCSSRGCYAMTDAEIEEIYALAMEAFKGGQTAFNVHAYPFRLTDANLAAHSGDKWIDFWRNLKEGYDFFEATNRLPGVGAKDGRYVFYDDAQTPLDAASFAGGGRVTLISQPGG